MIVILARWFSQRRKKTNRVIEARLPVHAGLAYGRTYHDRAVGPWFEKQTPASRLAAAVFLNLMLAAQRPPRRRRVSTPFLNQK
jgi:hypothetical protein